MKTRSGGVGFVFVIVIIIVVVFQRAACVILVIPGYLTDLE